MQPGCSGTRCSWSWDIAGPKIKISCCYNILIAQKFLRLWIFHVFRLMPPAFYPAYCICEFRDSCYDEKLLLRYRRLFQMSRGAFVTSTRLVGITGWWLSPKSWEPTVAGIAVKTCRNPPRSRRKVAQSSAHLISQSMDGHRVFCLYVRFLAPPQSSVEHIPYELWFCILYAVLNRRFRGQAFATVIILIDSLSR